MTSVFQKLANHGAEKVRYTGEVVATVEVCSAVSAEEAHRFKFETSFPDLSANDSANVAKAELVEAFILGTLEEIRSVPGFSGLLP